MIDTVAMKASSNVDHPQWVWSLTMTFMPMTTRWRGSGAARRSRPAIRKLQANTSAGSPKPTNDLVAQEGPVPHGGLHRCFEQGFPALEVVVEPPGLSDVVTLSGTRVTDHMTKSSVLRYSSLLAERSPGVSPPPSSPVTTRRSFDEHRHDFQARRDRLSPRRPSGRCRARPGTPFRPRHVDGEVGGLARAQPGLTARRLGGLGAEAGRVLTGTSTLAPQRGDRRFTDVAWTENPLLKRLVQLYLAGGQTVEQLVIDADLDPRDRKRVQFFLENLIQATAPSNVPLVNPASAKAVIDTAGLSLVRGGQQLVNDLASAPRIPEMVDGSGFVLGENIAATPGGIVFRNEVLELIQYAPQTDEVYEVPALVVPPTINKFYALDLAPERSLVEYGVRQGRQMFVISWRNPDSRHASWNLDTYVRAVLDALDAVEEITGSERTVLGGVCSGGILASMAAAYLAGIGRQDRLAALCLAVTVIDNHDAGTAPPSPTSGWRAGPRRSRRARDTSTAGRWPRCSRGSGPATWCGTTGSTTTCSASGRRRSTSCSGTPTPPG